MVQWPYFVQNYCLAVSTSSKNGHSSKLKASRFMAYSTTLHTAKLRFHLGGVRGRCLSHRFDECGRRRFACRLGHCEKILYKLKEAFGCNSVQAVLIFYFGEPQDALRVSSILSEKE